MTASNIITVKARVLKTSTIMVFSIVLFSFMIGQMEARVLRYPQQRRRRDEQADTRGVWGDDSGGKNKDTNKDKEHDGGDEDRAPVTPVPNVEVTGVPTTFPAQTTVVATATATAAPTPDGDRVDVAPLVTPEGGTVTGIGIDIGVVEGEPTIAPTMDSKTNPLSGNTDRDVILVEDPSGLSPGAIAGIAIGGVAVVVLGYAAVRHHDMRELHA